jgi:hypothetical protein
MYGIGILIFFSKLIFPSSPMPTFRRLKRRNKTLDESNWIMIAILLSPECNLSINTNFQEIWEGVRKWTAV